MQVTPKIHALRVPFAIPIAPDRQIDRFVYVYMLLGQNEVWLVDTGVAGTEKLIAEYLRQMGLELGDVSTVVLTHSHPDHIGAAHAIQHSTHCEVLIHGKERMWLEDVAVQRRERPVPGFDALVGGSAIATRTIADGDRLALDSSLKIEVLHTPGHSAGSVSLWLEGERALLTGDAVISPGDLPIYDDFRQCVTSIERLAGLKGVEVLLSSWDEPKRGKAIAERFLEGIEYLTRIDEAVGQIADRARPVEPMALCAQAIDRLGLPAVAVNPLVAKALMSHLGGDGVR